MRYPEITTRFALALFGLIPVMAPFAGAQERASTTAVKPVLNSIQLREAISKAPSAVIDLSKPANVERIEPVPNAPVPSIKLTAPTLKPGQVRIKALSRDVDDASRQLILGRVPQIGKEPARSKPATVLKGAAEMLSDESKQLTLRAVALADTPLRFNGERRRYEGTLSLGVVELEPSGQAVKLSAPITFEVLGVVARPKRVSATTTAPPFETVIVEADNPGESVSARVWSVLDPTGEAVLQMPVEKPTLSVTVSPDTIQGWGLQTAKVLVRAEQVLGGKFTVQVASQLGEFDSNSVNLDEMGMGEASLRSASTGRDIVSVSGAPFDGVEKPVEFVFPLRYILAATLGGVAGGLLRIGGQRRRAKRIALDVLLAVIAGAIVLGLFVLGVNVTGFGLPAQAGEVLVFVVAALGAFAGTRLLSPGSSASS